MPAHMIRDRLKILDLAIHASQQELTIFLCVSNNASQPQKSVHEFKYTNVSRISDITSSNLRHTKLFDLDLVNTAANTAAKSYGIAGIALGFDKNPYDSADSKPVRIYSVSNSSIVKFDIATTDAKTPNPSGVKVRTNVS